LPAEQGLIKAEQGLNFAVKNKYSIVEVKEVLKLEEVNENSLVRIEEGLLPAEQGLILG
jgi:hypothetical protein